MPVAAPSPKTKTPKPLLFDQARHSYGRIWLRPQVVTDKAPKVTQEGRFLKLTFRLNENPDLAVMNELALSLQFLPHVDQIRFEDLYAPREQITDFMRWVYLASKLKPLVRRLHARRQLRKIRALAEQSKEKPPQSMTKMRLEHNHHSTCDWSSAWRDYDHSPGATYERQDLRKKRKTWPPLQQDSLFDGISSIEHPGNGGKVDIPTIASLINDYVPHRVNTLDGKPHERSAGKDAHSQ